MKKASVILSLIGLILSGCFENEVDCVKGEGNMVSREFFISPFSEFAIYVPAAVEFTRAKSTSLTIEGQENVLDALNIIGTNGKLIIGEGNCFRSSEELRVYIRTPSVEEVKTVGSASVVSTGTFSQKGFKAEITGSGNVKFDLEVEQFSGYISGSGNMSISGIAEKQYFVGTGSGNFTGFDLAGGTAEISLSGSGNCEVNVTDHLKGQITGSGNVFYRGNPTLDVDISGSGKLMNVE